MVVVSTRRVVVEIKIKARNEALLEESFTRVRQNITRAVNSKYVSRGEEKRHAIGYIIRRRVEVLRVKA
jgi:hypothetical protein